MATERTESINYQLFLVFLSVAALIALAVDFLVTIDAESRQILHHADNAICAVFLFDFLRCLWRAEDRWRYFATWGWLDLAASIPVFDGAFAPAREDGFVDDAHRAHPAQDADDAAHSRKPPPPAGDTATATR